jgi:multidrug resistance protein MdtO
MDLALRGQIREWQPQLRMLFLTRITLYKYRLQLPGFELPSAVCDLQLEFDSQLAATLEGMADRLEEKAPRDNHDFRDSFERLESAVRARFPDEPHKTITAELKTFLALSQTAGDLVTSLANKV